MQPITLTIYNPETKEYNTRRAIGEVWYYQGFGYATHPTIDNDPQPWSVSELSTGWRVSKGINKKQAYLRAIDGLIKYRAAVPHVITRTLKDECNGISLNP